MSGEVQDQEPGVRHVKFKGDVRLNLLSLQPKMMGVLQAAMRTAPPLYNHVMLVTSGDDGRHADNSKHYTGHAFDIRIIGAREGAVYLGPGPHVSEALQQAEARRWVERIKERLGDRYVVLYEENHIHIQYGHKSATA